MGFYLNKVVIMSNNKELYGNSYKELKVQLTDINEEFGKEMMKEHFKNYLEYDSNGDSLDQGRKIRKHEQDVRKTLEKLLKLFDEEDVIEVMESLEEKENMTNDALGTYDDDDSNGDVIASLESYDVTGKGRILGVYSGKIQGDR